MTFLRSSPVRTALLALLAAALLPVTQAAAAGWSVAQSPNVDHNGFNQLNGVAAVSSAEAWAVGFQRPSGSSLAFHALIEHRGSSGWSIVPAASPPQAQDTRLLGVGKVASGDVWAVGTQATASGASSLIEHWNGTAWAVVPSPSNEPASSTLTAVSAAGASDVWAVGYSGAGTLAEHWDGTRWRVVTTPNVAAGRNMLLSVAAISLTDVWAVGKAFRHTNPLVEHWDGTRWNVVPQPDHSYDSSLDGISALSGSDIWAVGTRSLGDTLVEHWDGVAWSVVPSPNVTGNNAQDHLFAVAAFPKNDVWAVGTVLQGFSTTSTLVEHFDGTRWSLVTSPNVGQFDNQLLGLSGVSGGALWAAGFSRSPSATQTLILANQA